jgi:hypothetical protein
VRAADPDSPGSAAPPARVRLGLKIVLAGIGVLVILYVGGLLQRRLFWGPKACQVLKSAEVAEATGTPVGPSTSFIPDPKDARTTGCYLGSAVTGTYAIVFAVDREAEPLFVKTRASLLTQGTALRETDGPEYRSYAGTGPLGSSESLSLLRDGTYVNVLLFNAPAGSVDKLAAVIASRIG